MPSSATTVPTALMREPRTGQFNKFSAVIVSAGPLVIKACELDAGDAVACDFDACELGADDVSAAILCFSSIEAVCEQETIRKSAIRATLIVVKFDTNLIDSLDERFNRKSTSRSKTGSAYSDR